MWNFGGYTRAVELPEQRRRSADVLAESASEDRLDSPRAGEHPGGMVRVWGGPLIALLMARVHLEGVW